AYSGGPMMKALSLLSLPVVFACILASCGPARTPRNTVSSESASAPKADPFAPNPPAGMKLVWSDEFNVDGRPDPANWTYETGYVRNHEAQWYRPESAEVRDGCLVITGEHHEQPLPNPRGAGGRFGFGGDNRPIEYTSACLITKGLHSFQFGRIEARVKAPLMEGSWPAFWTLGVSENWPSCGEIDIFEYYKETVLANFCWSAAGGQWSPEWSTVRIPLGDYRKDDPEWADKFHVYAMDWDENRIVLSVDGRAVNDSSIAGVKNARYRSVENPFRQPHYLLVNLALGGDNGGDVTKVPFPVHMYVDYVRVY
ncbi:MAG: glycoside hydrolase family 16 protein, partial [Lentisphaeria bacterium]|nr:glycoside hydrolase family 16 protein [Lentisphaeria bacterium]